MLCSRTPHCVRKLTGLERWSCRETWRPRADRLAEAFRSWPGRYRQSKDILLFISSLQEQVVVKLIFIFLSFSLDTERGVYFKWHPSLCDQRRLEEFKTEVVKHSLFTVTKAQFHFCVQSQKYKQTIKSVLYRNTEVKLQQLPVASLCIVGFYYVGTEKLYTFFSSLWDQMLSSLLSLFTNIKGKALKLCFLWIMNDDDQQTWDLICLSLQWKYSYCSNFTAFCHVTTTNFNILTLKEEVKGKGNMLILSTDSPG